MIEPGAHLERCMVYTDLNMVRCGVVSQPRQWPWCGYGELIALRQRFRILDSNRVLELLGAEAFRRHYEGLIHERIAKDQLKREAQWTESIAVGSEQFVRQLSEATRCRQRLELEQAGDTWTLKEPPAPYNAI